VAFGVCVLTVVIQRRPLTYLLSHPLQFINLGTLTQRTLALAIILDERLSVILKMEGAEKFYHPYEPYDIQLQFMRALYDCIEQGKIGVFESPTGK
jgi:hypothetical protein